MAAVTRNAQVTLASKLPSGPERVGSGYICGMNLVAGDAVNLQWNAAANTWLVMQASGAANNNNATVHGFVLENCYVAQGDAVTIVVNVDLVYGNNLHTLCNGTYTAGPLVYLSATVPGGLDTTAPFVGAFPIGYILDDQRIRVFGNS